MWRRLIVAVGVSMAVVGCSGAAPATWDGPVLAEPRAQLTVDQLSGDAVLPLLDLSFFAKPAWALDDVPSLAGTLTVAEAPMVFPKERDPYPGEDLLSSFAIEFVTRDGALVPTQRGVLDTRLGSGSLWDVSVGTGAVWREPGDDGWSRAAFPLNLSDRFMGQVRNCVATFLFDGDEVSNTYMQCSQETADLQDQQVGDIRAMAHSRFEPDVDGQADQRLAACQECGPRRLPVRPLSEIDTDGEIAAYFDRSLETNASTSLGAVYLDGRLYRHPPGTRHGRYPYPDEMRHGVYSATKSLAGALAMFYFAERYGEDVFNERVRDHVPALADAPGWEGVTFGHALNMATGTRGGEALELLFEPLVSAPTANAAIANIAQLGDHPQAPGEAFEYATTNTFVLSRALENYVRTREGPEVHYWDLVHDDVLVPIGAADFRVLHTRDANPSDRIPFLGYGALPSLDTAAKISVLIANEGDHEGRQLLNRNRIREALGRTSWRGFAIDESTRYRHSFWSTEIETDGCDVPVTYMQGHGGNHVFFLPSGAIVFRFMDEFDMDFAPLIQAVERVKSSCP